MSASKTPEIAIIRPLFYRSERYSRDRDASTTTTCRSSSRLGQSNALRPLRGLRSGLEVCRLGSARTPELCGERVRCFAVVREMLRATKVPEALETICTDGIKGAMLMTRDGALLGLAGEGMEGVRANI